MNEQSEKNSNLSDLILDECKLISSIFEDVIKSLKLELVDYSLDEITFSSKDLKLVFCYYPERYEYGNFMMNKGMKIELYDDVSRRYSLRNIAVKLGASAEEIDEVDDSLIILEHNRKLLIKYLFDFLKEKDFSWESKLIKVK